MDLLREGEVFAREMRQEFASVPATYYSKKIPDGPGYDFSDDISVVMAATEIEVDNGSTIVKRTIQDFLIEVDEFHHNHTTHENDPTPDRDPRRGDLIQLQETAEWTADDGRTEQLVLSEVFYEVADIGNEHCWKYHGRDRKTYRVHTIEVPKPPFFP